MTSGGGGQRKSVECVYHHTFGPLIPLVSPSSAQSKSKQLPISIRRKGVQLRVSTGIDWSRFMLLSPLNRWRPSFVVNSVALPIAPSRLGIERVCVCVLLFCLDYGLCVSLFLFNIKSRYLLPHSLPRSVSRLEWGFYLLWCLCGNRSTRRGDIHIYRQQTGSKERIIKCTILKPSKSVGLVWLIWSRYSR